MAKKKKELKHKNSLTKKIVSLTVFLDALFLILILAGAVFLYYWNLNRERQDSAIFQSQVISERYNEIINDVSTDIHHLATDDSIIDYINYVNTGSTPIITDSGDPNYSLYTNYLLQMQSIMTYQEDALFDLVYIATSTNCSTGDDGCGITQDGELSFLEWNLTDRPWYLALDTVDFAMTGPYADGFTDENVISFVEKVYDNDTLIGYVGVDIKISTLSVLLDELFLDVTAEENEIILYSSIAEDPQIMYLSTDTAVDYVLADFATIAALDEENGFGDEGISYITGLYRTDKSIQTAALNSKYIIVFTDIDNGNFAIATLYNSTTVFSMEIMFIILVGVAIVMIFLIGMLMSRSVNASLSPIDSILKSIEEIRNGNYDVHIKVKEDGEIKEIGNAINLMSEEINRQIRKTYDSLAYDFLTGLKNRASASAEVDQTIFKSDHRSAVCLIQVDNLKNINVTKGQIIGDNLIKAIADELRKVFRNDETLFSNGGNEFVYIKENIKSLEEVEYALKRLLTHFKEPLVVKNIKTEVKLHVGVSVYPSDGVTLDDLIKKCDTALYKAAEEGYKKIIFYNEKIARSVSYQAEISEQLSQAITKNQIYLKYQPLITNSNEIYGFEALARWSSPTLGEIGPQVFIANAEESYLIIPIGTWILRQACLAQVEMRKRYDKEYIISVNVSPVQILQKDFVNIVKDIVKQTDINPEYLTLEITESLFIEASVLLEDTIEELHKIGIKLSLDDFGTGYASLTYLRQIAFDNLKIDKTFVDGIFANKKDHRIIGTIVNLVHNLDMKVIAEGVETKKQYEYLKEISTDVFQGYIFAKPLLLEEAYSFIDKFYKIPKTKRADVLASLNE
ncbi:MAG: EAL domain-containing protein [Bacilli bacterium]|nr:EAL domain-containing protein [Bacilli bacterium]